jgi:cytochrome d ubiquinol oxidase subunit I
VWGNLIHFGGSVMGLAFGWEGYAFMLESVFLAFYVTSWGKIKGWKHWWIGVPVAIGALGSALSITLGNAWMQDPGILTIVGGKVVSTNPVGALLTKTALFMTTHSVVGYYLATVLCVLGIYAFYYWRHKPTGRDLAAVRTIMVRLAVVSLVFSLTAAVLGHLQTQYLSVSEPRKFAALETVQTTSTNASYTVGGHWTADGKVEGGITIPSLLSILAGNSTNTKVQGLNSFAKTDWPMLFINLLFEAKMVFVGAIVVIPLAFVVLHSRRFKERLRDMRYRKPALLALMVTGPFAIITVELGWMIAEFGRQPFAVNGYLRTADAFSATSGVVQWGYLFPLSYVVLFAVTGTALWLLFKRQGKVQLSKELL